ncbi:MAG: DUF6351 family protein, partial [Pseudomonadota bacterium]
MKLQCLFPVVLTTVATLSACSEPAPSSPDQLSMELLSGQPHLVTAGDALLEIRHQGDSTPGLLVNDMPSTDRLNLYEEDGGQRVYRYRVRDLRDGENRVTVVAGQAEAAMSLVNYPASGPVISGSHQTPYYCIDQLAPEDDGSPRRFAVGNGEFLDTGQADEDCMLPTRVDHVYMAEGEESFRPMDNPDAPPDDAAMTETTEGRQVPYVVRLETGTLNRAIYQIAMLYDPVTGRPDPTRSLETTPSTWNGRLVYTFGGGCEAGYFQGTSTGGVLRDMMLSQGYAVASSTLNVNAQGGCNDVVSAETTMMVKERFIEQYGVPRYTIGSGASGGAMQQLLIAGAYPGLLDGLLPGMTFSDAVTYFTDAQECSGPLRRFVNDPELGLEDETRAAIGGWPNWYLCDESLGQRPDRISPYDCPEVIPPEDRYDVADNPDGVRCSIYDGMSNIFGERDHPELGGERTVAPSPHDNVGVQYGLAALNEGRISKALFLSLNESIGGW